MYACVYIPDFSAQAMVRGDPTLCHRAVATVEGPAPLLRVVSLNDLARSAGIELGMTVAQVSQLCSGSAAAKVEVRHRSPVQEAATHAVLLDCGYAVSPRLEDTAVDTVLLDLAGLERSLGSPEKIAHRLMQQALGLGLEIHVAVASNPDSALLAARSFPGITLIPPGEEAGRLGCLPVEVLAPPPEMLETLRRWGVRTFRALAALPVVPLSERLGQEGAHLQALARGAAWRPLAPALVALHFEEAMELEYSVAELEPLAFILGRLLNQLCARLAARGLATNELTLQLGLEVTPNSESRVLRLPVPMRDSKVFLKLLQLNLQADPPPAPVVKVVLAANPVKPRAAQGGLFVPLSPDPEKLEVVLARIASVVGKQNVGSPELVDTHRPDAFRMQRFVGGPASATDQLPIVNQQSSIVSRTRQSKIRNSKPKMVSPESRLRVALRVFRPPVLAQVEVRGKRPVRIFSAAGVRGEIVSASGPWRTSGDWWTTRAWERDEWDVAVVSPGATQSSDVSCKKHRKTALYRIYRDPSSGNWFVQGTYD